MIRKLSLLALFIIFASMQSCVDKNLDKILFGTWNVAKVEGVRNESGASVFAAEDNSPIGTITFNRDGSGEQNYGFTFDGVTYPQTGEFTWEASDEEIIILRSSESDMVWTRIFDTENRQVASYNMVIDATTNWDYILTLEK